MKIAKAAPFEGAPKINSASVFGASTGKGFMYRIPVTGKRPIDIEAIGLKDGMKIKNGIISGKIDEDCEFDIEISAKNELGEARKSVKFKIHYDNPLLTPLMGFTSWNAFGEKVTQELMENTAETMCESGLADYGYCYVNLDSGWQEDYGGKYNAVMPNGKFPDMKKMCENIHSFGLKCGMYSTPLLHAWGSIYEEKTFSGCTKGEPNILYTNANSGIGTIRLEENNAKQWDEWGFDYLKYDWNPTDPTNADYMKQALMKLKREFAFCVTVQASPFYGNYWKKYCNSWRSNTDSIDTRENIKERFYTVDVWDKYVVPGHFYDLDMLETGTLHTNGGKSGITEDEAVFAYTLRAFFMSPIQLSCDLSKLTDFEYNLYCNDEIIAIHQDSLAKYPQLISENGECKVYKRQLENGDEAWAIFNAGDTEISDTLDFEKNVKIRDVWTKEDLSERNSLNYNIGPHCVMVLRISA